MQRVYGIIKIMTVYSEYDSKKINHRFDENWTQKVLSIPIVHRYFALFMMLSVDTVMPRFEPQQLNESRFGGLPILPKLSKEHIS